MSRKEKKRVRGGFVDDTRDGMKKNPVLFSVYFILRLLIVITMVLQALNKDYYNVLLCLFTLVLFMIPSFIERRIKIDIPDTLEIIVLIFIFAAEILGEIREYYILFPYWDTLLHTTNGFICAAVGIAFIDILNQNDKFAFKMSPFFVSMVAFTFSMTIGVLWEFFEFGMDYFFNTDMQKDTVLTSISSVLLNPDGRNVPVTVDIQSVAVNGEMWNYGGYIDVGLYDTMADLFVNFIGAIVFSIIGYFYVKGKGKNKFATRFIPTKIDGADGEDESALVGAGKDK